MSDLDIVARGFDYPSPGSLNRLRLDLESVDDRSVRAAMAGFVSAVEALSLGEWEELHTRTVDLSPLFVPYVGHVMWGENYRRGAFMADLQAVIRDSGTDAGGELPDHLAPALRLLAADLAPADLIEVFPDAIAEMRSQLKKAERANPYRHLLDAAAAAVSARMREGARL